MKTRFAATAAIALTALLTLSGCANAMEEAGSNPDSSPTESVVVADANSADVMFTAMMIPHHEQAVEMADMVLGKDGIDERVVTLAQEIKAAQGPEIELMTSWVEGWGVGMTDGMDGMGNGDGMMSDSDMADLEAANGDDASRLFLEQMIVHHEGAIDMAELEIDSGQNEDVLALAQEVMDAQTTEISLMRSIISSL
ncbi:DUF305 domain-containing protein [Salinibacterium sp. SWN248]|uniref:DUF305 domain-containing protein n=1 Tax=Salinibacterium sp. SWN248 TaxID=2792056 RepID=UPI0018CDF047|nr:DUF305 domain-containing protein [Salinibacterium sp. SWN248]MBH0022915.1 DUF305 domain-containing protein [Salinibacterium sp. SWN248]